MLVTVLCIIPLVLSASIHAPSGRKHTHRSTQASTTVGLGDINGHANTNVTPPASGYWYASIQKRGAAAFNENPTTYKVFRNVLDYGAKGKYGVLGRIAKYFANQNCFGT